MNRTCMHCAWYMHPVDLPKQIIVHFCEMKGPKVGLVIIGWDSSSIFRCLKTMEQKKKKKEYMKLMYIHILHTCTRGCTCMHAHTHTHTHIQNCVSCLYGHKVGPFNYSSNTKVNNWQRHRTHTTESLHSLMSSPIPQCCMLQIENWE